MAKASKAAQINTSSPLSLKKASLGGQLVLGALIAEMLASAVLALAALMSGNNPIIAGVTVVILVLMFSELSGANINPVVTVAAWATRQMSWVKALGYIVAQVIGAMIAYVIVSKFMSGAASGAASGPYTLFTPADQAQSLQQVGQAVHMPGQWKPIFGELVGAVIFSFGIASAMFYKKTGFDRAFVVGGSLMIGLVAALAGSYGVVNPAVALSLSGFAQGGWWSIGAYAIAPLAGGAVGAGLFRLLKQDVDAAEAKA
jgi:glycerol uptake facilitator-like aquaporin